MSSFQNANEKFNKDIQWLFEDLDKLTKTFSFDNLQNIDKRIALIISNDEYAVLCKDDHLFKKSFESLQKCHSIIRAKQNSGKESLSPLACVALYHRILSAISPKFKDDPDFVDSLSYKQLNQAIAENNREGIREFIIRHCIDVNKGENSSPLEIALMNGSSNILDILEEAGGDLTNPLLINTILASLPWHTVEDRMSSIAALCKRGLDLNSRYQDREGKWKIILADLVGSELITPEVLQKLIDMGADVNRAAVEGETQTVLEYAISNNRFDLAKCLLYNGAIVRKPNLLPNELLGPFLIRNQVFQRLAEEEQLPILKQVPILEVNPDDILKLISNYALSEEEVLKNKAFKDKLLQGCLKQDQEIA